MTANGAPRGSAARFESEYASYRRQKRVYAALFGAAFVVCLVAAGVTAKFDVLTLIQGLPRTTEFLVKLIPGWTRSTSTSLSPFARFGSS